MEKALGKYIFCDNVNRKKVIFFCVLIIDWLIRGYSGVENLKPVNVMVTCAVLDLTSTPLATKEAQVTKSDRQTLMDGRKKPVLGEVNHTQTCEVSHTTRSVPATIFTAWNAQCRFVNGDECGNVICFKLPSFPSVATGSSRNHVSTTRIFKKFP